MKCLKPFSAYLAGLIFCLGLGFFVVPLDLKAQPTESSVPGEYEYWAADPNPGSSPTGHLGGGSDEGLAGIASIGPMQVLSKRFRVNWSLVVTSTQGADTYHYWPQPQVWATLTGPETPSDWLSHKSNWEYLGVDVQVWESQGKSYGGLLNLDGTYKRAGDYTLWIVTYYPKDSLATQVGKILWQLNDSKTVRYTVSDVPPDPLQLKLVPTSIASTASLSAAPSTIVLGESVSLALGQTQAASSGRHLDGPGLPSNSLSEPANSVVATPTELGTANYSYTVPGGVIQLKWSSNTPTGTFSLHLPSGSTVDVTGRFDYKTTLPGDYYITQTNALGTADSPVLNVVLPAPAVATVSVTVLPKDPLAPPPDDPVIVPKTTPKLPEIPAPLPEPKEPVTPGPDPDPTPDPTPTPKPDPAPGPDPTPTPDPTPNPDPLPEPQPNPGPAPTPDPIPTPEPVVFSIKPSLRMLESSVRVEAPGTVYHGKHYKRGWLEGGAAHAYLGRAGLRFEGAGTGLPSARAMQLQAKSPEAGAQWQELSEGPVSDVRDGAASGDFSCGFEVRLGGVKADAPLIPLSYAEGHALTGQWLFRTRVSDGAGQWSAWSEDLPVQVVLPLSVKEETLQTVPPAGAEGDWFSSSAPKTFRIGLWIP